METYRVIFDNNSPIHAQLMGKSEKSGIGAIAHNGKKQIKWLAVDACDEQDSISVANDMMRSLKRFL